MVNSFEETKWQNLLFKVRDSENTWKLSREEVKWCTNNQSLQQIFFLEIFVHVNVKAFDL